MQVLAHQRLSAGQPQLVDAQRHTHANNPFDFFKRQQLRAVHEDDVFGRHAVETANITAIGHADPQVVVHAAERIDELCVTHESPPTDGGAAGVSTPG